MSVFWFMVCWNWMASNEGMFRRSHFQEFNHDKLMTEYKSEKITENERNKGKLSKSGRECVHNFKASSFWVVRASVSLVCNYAKNGTGFIHMMRNEWKSACTLIEDCPRDWAQKKRITKMSRDAGYWKRHNKIDEQTKREKKKRGEKEFRSLPLLQ